MTLGLLSAGPLQMLFSLLLMQGLSLTMFRTFLNQAIPRFDPMRFQMSIGNDQRMSGSTTPAPNLDTKELMPYLNLLAPFLIQQQMQRSQQMNQQMPAMMAPNAQQIVQPQVVAAPVSFAQQPHHQVMPQVIILPQMVPQMSQQSSKGSASTHIPVQVEPPEEDEDENDIPVRVTKRMLERPPKTTRRPKIYSRAHAGTMHVEFVTPKAPSGFRRYIIPPVTANLETLSTQSTRRIVTKTSNAYSSTQSSLTTTGADIDDDLDTEEEDMTTNSIEDNLINSSNKGFSDSILTTTSSPFTTINLIQTPSAPVDTIDENLQNHNMDETKVNSKPNITENIDSINDLIHEDFVEHIKNISNKDKIQSNQSPDDDSDNSKEPKSQAFKRVCYYLLRAKDGDLKVSDIDPFICTHLIVGFASVTLNDLLVPRDPSEDPDKYRSLTNLKSLNRNLKVMLSVGDGNGVFSKIVSNGKSRDNFVASALDICDQFGFDGIDIDWEFPHLKSGSKRDKQNFILLLKEIRVEAIRRFKDDFILSATVGTPLVIAMASYNIPLIADAVDFVNLMSYDFNIYRSDRPYTGHHSPLYPRPSEKGYYMTLNAAWSATYWANKGMPLNKIILGIPTYARTYSLVVPIAQGLDVPVTGPGLGGGKLNYTSVCHFLSSGATKEFDIYSQVPFAYKGYDWVAYESEVSAALKAQWVVKAGMGGVMTFALNFDDTKGDCRKDGKRFPIQKAISNLLELSSIPTYRRLNSHSPEMKHYFNKH